MRDFQVVSLEFCTSEEEYEEFVSTLSRQDIDLMIKFLLSEIAIVESSNRIDILQTSQTSSTEVMPSSYLTDE